MKAPLKYFLLALTRLYFVCYHVLNIEHTKFYLLALLVLWHNLLQTHTTVHKYHTPKRQAKNDHKGMGVKYSVFEIAVEITQI